MPKNLLNYTELSSGYFEVVTQKIVLKLKTQEQAAEIKKLSHNISLLKKHLYGSQSEKSVRELSPLQEGAFSKDLSSRPVAEKEIKIKVEGHNRKKRKAYTDGACPESR